MHTIIGLYSPAAQSGKSTVARYLNYAHGYTIEPFAYTLKQMTSTLLLSLGYSADQTYAMLTANKETYIKELGVNTRHLLRTLGTEWGMDCVHPQLWLKCWESRLIPGERTVADDVRFPNEAALVKRLGGVMVRVIRPGQADKTDHRSEGALDDYAGFDYTIVNDGDLEKLRHTVEEVLGLV